MAGDAISIDEVFARQQQPRELVEATLEPVADRPDDVRVTPYLRNAGCLCTSALVLPKHTIESVTTTDESHWCCGKQLAVVQVKFVDPMLADIFTQLVYRAARSTTPPPEAQLSGRPWAAGPPMSISNRYVNPIMWDPRSLAAGYLINFTTGMPVQQWPGATGGASCAEQRANCHLRCAPGDERCQCHCELAFYACIGQPAPYGCDWA